MERHETDADEVVTRLRSLGSTPIDEALAAEHLAAMQTAGVSTPNRWRRYATAGAATVALLAGSSSLAAAGVLPDAAQGIAHDILDTVGVDVPDQARGACVSAIAMADEVPPGDGHGDAVSQAAREDCAPDTSADDTDAGGPPDDVTTGPPTTTPVGPPADVPRGPPDGVPNGPPAGVPNGPPAGVPNGPPDGVPPGPPAGVPNGPPDGVPPGPPAGLPNGPPAGLPNGPPDGVPPGPPAGVPNGPPADAPGGRP